MRMQAGEEKKNGKCMIIERDGQRVARNSCRSLVCCCGLIKGYLEISNYS